MNPYHVDNPINYLEERYYFVGWRCNNMSIRQTGQTCSLNYLTSTKKKAQGMLLITDHHNSLITKLQLTHTHALYSDLRCLIKKLDTPAHSADD